MAKATADQVPSGGVKQNLKLRRGGRSASHPPPRCLPHAMRGPVQRQPGPPGAPAVLTPSGPDGKMPPREEPPMDRRGSSLSRRTFVVGAGAGSLGLLAGRGRWPGQAQQPPQVGKVPRVGCLNGAPPTATASTLNLFRQALGGLGYVE